MTAGGCGWKGGNGDGTRRVDGRRVRRGKEEGRGEGQGGGRGEERVESKCGRN